MDQISIKKRKDEVFKAAVDVLFQHLEGVDSFDRTELFTKVDGATLKDRDFGLALWDAMEKQATVNNRRFVSRGGGTYALAAESQRVRRVNSRRRAASKIFERQLDEVRRIDKALLSDKEQRALDRVETQISDLSIRMKIRQRSSAKKKPAGL